MSSRPDFDNPLVSFYEYTVNGHTYRSDRLAFGHYDLWPYIAYYPGESGTVYVDPKDPASAVLKPGYSFGLLCVNASFLFFFAWGILFLFFALPFKHRKAREVSDKENGKV